MNASLPVDLNDTQACFDGHVVCIGASAGGLDALERFFKACPHDTGAAFVVIQHLSPDHKSIMNNLLARHTEMPVIMVEDAMPITANSVYLIPPGTMMHITAGYLHLTPKPMRGLNLPIDVFFCSLAEVYRQHAIGVILSGTGTDGTRGAEAINAAGGLLLAQDPETAKFDGMPRSIINTGLVNAVLPAEDLPNRLLAHIKNLPVAEPVAQQPAKVVNHRSMSHSDLMAAILNVLHQVTGIDFADYKPATIQRRIERRMQICHTPELFQYLDLLETDRGEVLNLRREMLISVTSFFRDPEAFEAVYQQVISPLVAETSAGSSIRVWTAGVASGEEAYTLAILFLEAFDQFRCWPNLKIFATDIDQQCIETAGAGQYPESAVLELSPERVNRFFVRNGERFSVKNELRQCIVFARHNLLADPPFTKMDLVVCRNTLIYFKSAAQERALRALQYAVRDGGALMLGTSESISAVSDGMQAINAKLKLFRRKSGPALPVFRNGKRSSYPKPIKPVSIRSSRSLQNQFFPDYAQLGITALLNRYAPPSILVSANHEALHLFGEVHLFFRPREGSASLDIVRLLPDPLVPIASALLYKAEREQVYLMSEGITLTLVNGERSSVRLSVQPLPTSNEERLTLLSFHTESAKESLDSSVDVDVETLTRLSGLEHELAATRESLQATIEELETSNEELQATNEELMASNEELQSSNEELQSVNEEMNTVNVEFQEKMQILHRLNADLDSMAKAAGVATVFVDEHLHITRYTPDATQVFKLRETDIGRRLDDIQHNLNYPNLMLNLETILQTERMMEREVKTLDDSHIYLARLLPYQVPSTHLRGAIATFVDVTAFHDAKRLQTVIDALSEHIVVLDPEGKIVMFNTAWKRFALANGDSELRHSGIGVNYLNACLTSPEFDLDHTAEAAQRGLRGILGGMLPNFSIEYPCHSATEQRWFVMNVSPLHSDEFGAVVSHVNITEWRNRRNS